MMSLEDPLLDEEDYQDFARALQWRDGFGIFFAVCTPIQAERLIKRIKIDIPNQNIASLELESPIDNLYDKVEAITQEKPADVLFIQGLEKSLIEYIKPGYGGRGDYYKEDSVPRILGHLNLQRERFRDTFKNTRFVFLLPLFALRYFILRAPDFFDWRSGVFEFSTEENLIKQEISKVLATDTENYKALTDKERHQKLLEIQALIDEPNQTEEDKIKLYHKHISLLWLNDMYEEAITSCEKVLQIKANDMQALENCIYFLFHLGRMEEALEKVDIALALDNKNNKILVLRCFAFLGLKREAEALVSANELIKLQPEELSSWVIHSFVFSSMNEHRQALKSLEQAKILEPKNAVIWSLRGNIYGELKNYNEALVSYNKAIKLGENSFDVLLKKSATLLYLKRYDAAIESCDKSLQIKAGNWRALGLRAGAYFKLKRYDEALNDINNVIQHKPNDAGLWGLKGTILANLKHYDEALASYDKALSLSPNDIEISKKRSLVLIELNRPDEAIESFALVAKASEDEAGAWVSYAEFLSNKVINNIEKKIGNIKRKNINLKSSSFGKASILAVNKALEINPSNHMAYIYRGAAKAYTGNAGSALIDFEKAVELKKDDRKLYSLMIFTQIFLGQYDDALLSIEQAIALDPKEYKVWAYKGYCFAKLECYQEALDSYLHALYLKKNDVDLYLKCAETALRLENIKTALMYLHKIIRLKPKHHQAWLRLGQAKALLGKPKKEVLVDLNKSVQFNPDKYEALINKTHALFHINYNEEAKIECNKAILACNESITKDENDDSAFYNRACCYALLEDVDAAISDLKQAIHFDSDYVDQASDDNDFDKIKDSPEFQALINASEKPETTKEKITEFKKKSLFAFPEKTTDLLLDFIPHIDNKLNSNPIEKLPLAHSFSLSAK